MATFIGIGIETESGSEQINVIDILKYGSQTKCVS